MAHSTDLRERIINAVIHKRYTLQKAADTFDVGAATVSRYLRRYRQTGEISPPEPPQVAPAPSMSTRPGLSRASSATTSPTTSAATCCSTKLASASAEPPGAAGYRDWDRREKKTIYASEQGPEARWRYLAWIQQIDPHRSVFVDESGFNLAMTLPYAYAPGDNVPWVGCRRAVGRRPAWLQPSVSMRVVSDAMTSTGAVAGVAFLAYLEHPLAPRPRPGQIVVLDRLGVHRKPEVREAIEARGASRCCCLGTARTSTQRVGFQQDRGVRESCGGEDEGERWTLRSRLRWGRCRWGMWWVGLSMPESRITHCENRCKFSERGSRHP